MPEQFKFPFKKKEEEEKAASEVFKGRMPTIEEDKELTTKEGGRLTSEEKNQQAAKEALDKILERGKEDKEKREN